MQLRVFSLLFAGAAAARIHKGLVQGLDSSKDAVDEFVNDGMDAGLFSSAELSAGEALQSLDQDGDGGISKAEFQTHVDVKEITEYLAWLQGHAGEDWPTEPDARFQFLDEDGSGHLDEDEQERATSMAEVSVLLSRQAAQSNGSALEGTLGKKVEDPRCDGAREGFNCLAGKDLIYCTAGKRMGDQETCGWEGKCKRGILGSGGCDYHLCKGKVDGKYCGNSAGSKVVVQCQSKGAHGRIERESSKVNTCHHGGCRAFPDGPPPTRRRRTCNGGRVCTHGNCDTPVWMETEVNVTDSEQGESVTDDSYASLQWTVDGCAKKGERNRDEQISKWETSAVRCCSKHGSRCESKLMGCKRQTYPAAVATCAAEGMRLCSWHEMKTNLCCGTGCNFDLGLAWVLRDSYGKSDWNGNTHQPDSSRRRGSHYNGHCYNTPDPQDPPYARCN